MAIGKTVDEKILRFYAQVAIVSLRLTVLVIKVMEDLDTNVRPL